MDSRTAAELPVPAEKKPAEVEFVMRTEAGIEAAIVAEKAIQEHRCRHLERWALIAFGHIVGVS